MKLIIGNMSSKMKEFLQKYDFNSKIMVINKMCNVKTIKDDVEIIIPFGYINEHGLVNNTQVHLYELIFSVKVKKIIYCNLKAKTILESISNNYKIPIEYLDLNTLNKRTLI